MFADLALIAVATEAMIGYPDAVYRVIGHPVTWIGRLIAWCDKAWNSETLSYDERRWRGIYVLVLLLAVGVLSGLAITAVLEEFFHDVVALLLCGVIASSMLAQRSLYTHVAAVASALETDGIEAGRRAVSMIVGRDTRALDEAAVSRAAIESLAENFSDGVVAPLFWMVVAGLPGAIAYKAINTADSMIGHKSPRHLAFGWASARFDDLVNLPASRLSAFWFVLAAVPVAGPVGASGDRGAVPRRRPPPLAQCRLARGRDGRRARHPALRPAHLRWRRGGRALGGRWAQRTDRPRHPRGARSLSRRLRPADRGPRRHRAGALDVLSLGSRASASRRSQSRYFSIWSARRSRVASTSAS